MYVYIKGTIRDNVNNAVLFLFRFLFPVQSIILYYFGLLKRFRSPLLLSCDLYHSLCFSLFLSIPFSYFPSRFVFISMDFATMHCYLEVIGQCFCSLFFFCCSFFVCFNSVSLIAFRYYFVFLMNIV